MCFECQENWENSLEEQDNYRITLERMNKNNKLKAKKIMCKMERKNIS